jgi:glutamate synthase domain-containing protein 3
MRFVAEELREYMAQLGFRAVDEMVGRCDRLAFRRDRLEGKPSTLDLAPLLEPPGAVPDVALRCAVTSREPVACFDDDLIGRLAESIEGARPAEIELPIRNVNRTVGARMSGRIVSIHGPKGLPDGAINVKFYGSAGQSFGAFLSPGITFRVEGDVNDYLGKGMSGGSIVVVPPAGCDYPPHENTIAGNVVLYGATGGTLNLCGSAGERFCVRNSGAAAVVEGVGDHCCEYMTGGTVLVLGPTGVNFAAGMSGGTAYVYDPTGLFDTRCNLDMVDLEGVFAARDVSLLKAMLERHLELTGSQRALFILENWASQLPFFVKVMPIDYRRVLERMGLRPNREEETIAATEEVFPHDKTDRIFGVSAGADAEAPRR